MKLSDAMREKMLLSFELFPPKQTKEWKIFQVQSNIFASTNRNIFLVHTVPAVQTLERTWMSVR